MLPEEATEMRQADQVYLRRYDKMQRDYLKTLVSRKSSRSTAVPQGQHSEALERLLIYFRARPSPTNTRSRSSSHTRPTASSRCPAIAAWRRAWSRTRSIHRRPRPTTACSCVAFRICWNPER